MEQQTDLRPDGAVLATQRVNFGMNNWFVNQKVSFLPSSEGTNILDARKETA
jgi:hypothetical protein